MKIVRNKSGLIVRWSKEKDEGITWRKVREFCEQQIKN